MPMKFEKIKINYNEVGRQLLKGPGTVADLDRRAGRVAAAAGPGMEPSTRVGKTRARASVITATNAARRAEATNRSLTRAMDAARD